MGRRDDNPRQLLVDVSLIAARNDGTGIQRVVGAIWRQLTEWDRAGVLGREWVVRPIAATRTSGYRYLSNDTESAAITARAGDIFLALDLAPAIIVANEPILAQWRQGGVTIAFLVYDLLALHHPRWFTCKARANIRAWFDAVVRQGDHLICISDVVADDVRQRLAGRSPTDIEQRISRLSMGADFVPTRSQSQDDALARRFAAMLGGRPFALMVGTIEPRKGHQAVLRAFDLLWRRRVNGPDLALVLVGRPGWRTRLLQWKIRRHRENGTRLHWLSAASDAWLATLYQQCSLVIQASYAEGFGLPVIEALRHGRTVLARDIPIFHEVGGERLAYFDNDEPVELITAICDLASGGSNAPLAPLVNGFVGWKDSASDLLRLLGVTDDAGHSGSYEG